MEECPYSIAELLPHAGRMVLLDRVRGFSDNALEADVRVRRDNPFFERERGVAAHIAIEWMAQACGAFAGLQAKRDGLPVRIGFLLGTRSFKSQKAWFAEDAQLVVRAELVFRDGETGVFDCTLRDSETLAQAQLTLYQPSDLAAVLASQGIDATTLDKQ